MLHTPSTKYAVSPALIDKLSLINLQLIVCAHMLWCTYGGQREACKSCFSPSIMWVLEMEFRCQVELLLIEPPF